MKKGWKTFWIIMGVATAIGLTCIVIAIAFGLNATSVRRALDEGVGFTVSGFIQNQGEVRVDTYPGTTEFPESPEESEGLEVPEVSEETKVSFNGIKHLEIDIDVADVEIVSIDGKEIKIESSGFTNRYQFISRQEGGTLILETESYGSFSLGNFSSPKVKVSIPKSMEFVEVNIFLATGRLVADQINCEKLDLDVDAGDIVVSNFMAKELDMECAAGSIKASGEISREADLSCDVGRIELSAKGTKEDFNFDIEVDMGSISVGSERLSGLGTSKQIDNGANKTIEASVSVGEIVIDFH